MAVANALFARVKRPIWFLHLTVPSEHDAAAYFAPLGEPALHPGTSLFCSWENKSRGRNRGYRTAHSRHPPVSGRGRPGRVRHHHRVRLRPRQPIALHPCFACMPRSWLQQTPMRFPCGSRGRFRQQCLGHSRLCGHLRWPLAKPSVRGRGESMSGPLPLLSPGSAKGQPVLSPGSRRWPRRCAVHQTLQHCSPGSLPRSAAKSPWCQNPSFGHQGPWHARSGRWRFPPRQPR